MKGECIFCSRSDARRCVAAVAVLVGQEGDELGVLGQVVEGERDQLRHGFHGLQRAERELLFLLADLGVDRFERHQVQALLVVEVVIDELLVDPRGRGDLVDARAREALGGELGHGGGDERLLGGGRVALALGGRDSGRGGGDRCVRKRVRAWWMDSVSVAGAVSIAYQPNSW
jgi:hypothetical protein